MKKQQKEQIKKGGEMARAIYQTFMAKPQWMTYIQKDSILRLLQEVIEAREDERRKIRLRAAFLADNAIKNKDDDNSDEGRRSAREALKERARLLEMADLKYEGLIELKTLVRLLGGSDSLYHASQILIADFSMYCRDN